MVPDEGGPPVPEFARRDALSACGHDPVPAFVLVLLAMPAAGIPLGDILADSGYAYRIPAAWAIPLRTAGAQLVQDLHPNDRGPQGTHDGAIIASGNLYCPVHPAPCSNSGPSPAAPPPSRPPPTTQDRRSRPATSSAASPPATQTATTASCAPPPWARSAAPSAPPP